MSAPIMETVQLCFGLKASDKNPKTTLVADVEETVTRIAKQGTYTSGCAEKVYDTYERIASVQNLRAFIDLDIKKYKDGTVISKFEGIVLREQLREVFANVIPLLETKYGTVVLGDSSGMKSSTEYSVSFRMWFPQILGSRVAINFFANAIVTEYIIPNVGSIGDGKIDWVKFFDTSVYKSIVKLRLPGCTKQGENYRPLQIDYELSSKDTTYTDVLVSYSNPKYAVNVLKDPEPEPETETRNDTKKYEPRKPDTESIEYTTILPTSARLTDYQFNIVSGVANICKSDDWDDHNTRFLFIAALWNTEQSDRMRAFIHKQCEMKNRDNNPTMIEREIKNAHKYPISLNILMKHAWEYDRAAIATLKSTYLYFWDKTFRREEEEKAVREILRIQVMDGIWKKDTYSERFVKPYPFQEYDTLVIHSHMGTGKTVQLTGSKLYGIPALISREHFRRVLILSARRAYASFILGELEKEGLNYYVNYMDIKGDLSSENHLVLQMESLHRITERFTPYNVVIMDESESLLSQMNSIGTHSTNHRLNYEILEKVVHTADKVIAMDAFITSRTINFMESLRPDKSALYICNKYQPYDRKATEYVKLTESQILPNVAELQTRLLESACAEKRIVYVCSSKEKGYDMLALLEEKSIPVIFHCGDDTKDKKDLLLNVRDAWTKYQVVIYTSTITVGVSYSDIPEAFEFDELYLYASAGCALPRDIAQALLRARKIKSNQLRFCIECRCVMPKTFGYDKVSEQVVARRENPALKDLRWADTPKWVTNLISHNENEIAVSKRFYTNVLHQYLRDSGYIITEPAITKKVTLATERKTKKPRFEDIELLDDDAAAVMVTCIADEIATVDDRIKYTKYRFVHLFVEGTEMEYMGAVWNKFFCLPEDGGAAKKFTLEGQFWNIVHERQRNLEYAWNAETKYRYAEQARGSLLQQTTVAKLCDLLGIENTCVEKIWTHDEFSTLVPKILGIEDEVRSALILRESRSEEKDTEFNRAADFLKTAFESWSGTLLQKVNVKRIRVNGKLSRFYDISLAPIIVNMFDTLINKNNNKNATPKNTIFLYD